MPKEKQTRAKNLILGALVADAAALGLHWIYDQEHIAKLAPTSPEFRTPCVYDYECARGYFAHEGKEAGAQSQYGEQVLVMLRSLVANLGQYNIDHYAQQFRTHFGYGGTYVGFIDHATRQSLDNMTLADAAAATSARTIPFDGEDSITDFVVKKALSTRSQYGANEFQQRFLEGVRNVHDDDEIVAHGLKVLAHIQATQPLYGANDEQFPATAKLPPLVAQLCIGPLREDASFYAQVESAITLTNTHERAVSYGRVCADMMKAAIAGVSVDDILQAGSSDGNGTGDASIQSAIKSALSDPSRSVNDVTREFGMACDLKQGVPSIAHNLATSTSFSEAIQNNIYAGGDSCGRAIVIGALAGATYGVGGEHGIPQQWIDKLHVKDELPELLLSLIVANTL